MSLYQYILKSFEINIDAMTILYYGLFHFLNTVFNLLNIHIYMVNTMQGSNNVVNNIERVQRALVVVIYIHKIIFAKNKI